MVSSKRLQHFSLENGQRSSEHRKRTPPLQTYPCEPKRSIILKWWGLMDSFYFRKSFLPQNDSSLSLLHHEFSNEFFKSQTLNLAENYLRTAELQPSQDLYFFCPLAILFSLFYHNNMYPTPLLQCCKKKQRLY